MKSRLNLTIEELKKYRYPNLMAEVQETTYSICTIAEHMGLGKYRKEDDAETWDKLTGKTEIMCSEAVGLVNLFGVTMEYLFSRKLKTLQGKTAAYFRWFDRHEQIKKDLQRTEDIRKIEMELKNNPYLLDFVKVAVTLNENQIDELVQTLEKRKVGETL